MEVRWFVTPRLRLPRRWITRNKQRNHEHHDTRDHQCDPSRTRGAEPWHGKITEPLCALARATPRGPQRAEDSTAGTVASWRAPGLSRRLPAAYDDALTSVR